MASYKLLLFVPRNVVHRSLVAQQKRFTGTAVTAWPPKADASEPVYPGQEWFPGKDEYWPKFGHREVVGHGEVPYYTDTTECPCPAIRFKEVDARIFELRKKEQGDWKLLSIEEKKELYRASFRQTLEESEAPTGDWKRSWADSCLVLGFCLFLMGLAEEWGSARTPHTLRKVWYDKQLEFMVRHRYDQYSGISSWFDYDKGKFKPTWNIYKPIELREPRWYEWDRQWHRDTSLLRFTPFLIPDRPLEPLPLQEQLALMEAKEEE